MIKPTFDSDGYPTQRTLYPITEWPIRSNQDIEDLLEFCKDSWKYRNYWGHTKGEEKSGEQWIKVSTGGWSGNEDIIGALEQNHIFWSVCWLESRKGGHYKFLTNPIKETE